MMELNEKLFDELSAGEKPLLVEYHAPWCIYCRRSAPAMEKLALREDLTVGQVNIDHHPDLARREQIEVVPTLVLYHKGEALGSIVAPESRARIDEFLEEYLMN